MTIATHTPTHRIPPTTDKIRAPYLKVSLVVPRDLVFLRIKRAAYAIAMIVAVVAPSPLFSR
jgi:hypothetical protein